MASQNFNDAQFIESMVAGNGITAEAPADTFEQQVLDELEKLRNPNGSWAKTLTLLVISVMLFIALGMKNSPVFWRLRCCCSPISLRQCSPCLGSWFSIAGRKTVSFCQPQERS